MLAEAAHLPQPSQWPKRRHSSPQKDDLGMLEVEIVEDEGRQPFCFSNRFFSCQICSVDDDDIRPRSRVDRLRSGWARLNDDASDRLEESELGDGDVSSEDSFFAKTRAVPSVPKQRESTRWHNTFAAEDSALQNVLEVVMRHQVFKNGGWELSHVSGDRYSLNRRGIKLTMATLGAPMPRVDHLCGSVGYELAEQAARIMVSDGPLRQPLLDYLLQTGQNETYDQRGTENTAGVTSGGKTLDFNVPFTGDRIIEMKQAQVQAEMRRRASGNEAETASALQGQGEKLLSFRSQSAGSVALSRGSSCQTTLDQENLAVPNGTTWRMWSGAR